MTDSMVVMDKRGLSVRTRDALTACSLANLLFLVHWSLLLNRGNGYKLKSRLEDHLLALMLDVALTAVLLWVASYFVRRRGSAGALRLMRVAFLVIVFAAFLRSDPAEHWLTRHMGKLAAILTPLVWCGLAAMVATRPRVVRALRDFLLILSPFVLVTFGQGAWSVLQQRAVNQAQAESTAAKLGESSATPPMIWILYDEMDYQVSFEQRPETLALPELDRMRSQALHASSAYPPSAQTLTSIPALLDGRLVARYERREADHLLVTYQGARTPVRWGSQPNLFSQARELGVNGAIVGWLHPYCRVFRGQLTQCFWEEIGDNIFALSGSDLVKGMRMQAEVALRLLYPPPFNDIQTWASFSDAIRRRSLEDHDRIVNRARDVLRDPDLGIVLIHLSIPHPPGIFDRRDGTFRTDMQLSYLDNLRLADRDFGELRRVLEETGRWDSSVVVVSSDHGWRPSFWRHVSDWTAEDELWSGHAGYRVPFLLKMPGQTTPLAYDQPFNTVLTSELLLAILRKEISDAEGVVNWLERHRSIGLSPYMENP